MWLYGWGRPLICTCYHTLPHQCGQGCTIITIAASSYIMNGHSARQKRRPALSIAMASYPMIPGRSGQCRAPTICQPWEMAFSPTPCLPLVVVFLCHSREASRREVPPKSAQWLTTGPYSHGGEVNFVCVFGSSHGLNKMANKIMKEWQKNVRIRRRGQLGGNPLTATGAESRLVGLL